MTIESAIREWCESHGVVVESVTVDSDGVRVDLRVGSSRDVVWLDGAMDLDLDSPGQLEFVMGEFIGALHSREAVPPSHRDACIEVGRCCPGDGCDGRIITRRDRGSSSFVCEDPTGKRSHDVRDLACCYLPSRDGRAMMFTRGKSALVGPEAWKPTPGENDE